MEYLANSGNISEELFFDVIKLLPKDRPGKYWITWNFLGIKKMMQMISEKEYKHAILLEKIINAKLNIKQYKLIDLLVMQDVIEDELIERGY